MILNEIYDAVLSFCCESCNLWSNDEDCEVCLMEKVLIKMQKMTVQYYNTKVGDYGEFNYTSTVENH